MTAVPLLYLIQLQKPPNPTFPHCSNFLITSNAWKLIIANHILPTKLLHYPCNRKGTPLLCLCVVVFSSLSALSQKKFLVAEHLYQVRYLCCPLSFHQCCPHRIRSWLVLIHFLLYFHLSFRNLQNARAIQWQVHNVQYHKHRRITILYSSEQ